VLPNDPFSAVTHFVAAIACAIGAFFLIRRASPRSRRAPLAIFAISAVTLLLASALFHWLPSGTSARSVAQRLDHAAIFTLIAGTFTPIHVILFRGVLRWGVLVLIWTFAITGLTLKTVFFRDVPEALGVSAYLALGWLGFFSMAFVYVRYGARVVSPLVLGGLAYTVGALCEFTGQPTLIEGVIGSHEVFHLAVLVGLACHWIFARRMANTDPEPRQRPRTRGNEPADDPDSSRSLERGAA
jgi:channel protein (hemolysin III family)